MTQTKPTVFFPSHQDGWTGFCGGEPVDTYISQAAGTREMVLEFVKNQQIKGRHVVGYISYDASVAWLGVEQRAEKIFSLPSIVLYAYPESSATSHATDSAFMPTFEPIISRSEYRAAYDSVKANIREGEIYQMNLTHCLRSASSASAYDFFQSRFSEYHPPFAAYIRGEDNYLLSFSPERFVKITGRTIITRPIKGTRPRGKSSLEDARLRTELLENNKEAAELNMITDLLRNDVGKVARPGSVRVQKHREVTGSANVWHTHSEIAGELYESVSSIEAVLSMLPGGSITGCPKKRAVEIIDELETYRRGPYTGIMIHCEPNGDLDSSILIRTIIQQGEELFLPVGGGIVWDSEEESEWKESLVKARSVFS